MVNKYTCGKVTWIDLENPTQDEVRSLMKDYNIHPLAAEELLISTVRSKVDRYDDFVYLAFNFPVWKHSHKETNQEIDFIVGKDYVVTARYDSSDPLHKFAKILEVNSVLAHNKLIGEHGGFMFYYMIKEIYHSLQDELESVKDSLSDIEKQTFKGRERDMVFEISNVSRKLLSFKHAMRLHDEVLASYGSTTELFFEKEYVRYVDSIRGESVKINKTVQGLLESLGELRETNNSLLETKQSEIMKTFTAITLVSSFLTIISGWFLIESPDKPFFESGHEFWSVGILMLVVALILVTLMKKMKWL